MKGLAWYSLAIIAFGCISMLIELISGIDVAINVWGIAFSLPIVAFFLRYIKNEK